MDSINKNLLAEMIGGKLDQYGRVEMVTNSEQGAVRCGNTHITLKLFESLQEEDAKNILAPASDLKDTLNGSTYLFPVAIKSYFRAGSGMGSDLSRSAFVLMLVDNPEGLSTQHVLDLKNTLSEIYGSIATGLLYNHEKDGLYTAKTGPIPKGELDSLEASLSPSTEKSQNQEAPTSDMKDTIGMKDTITITSIFIVQTFSFIH